MSDVIECRDCGKNLFSIGEVAYIGIDFHLCEECLLNQWMPSRKREAQDAHYTRLAIEPWEYIRANKLDFFEGNVIKYISRWRHKNGLEDLLKAKVYIEELIRQQEASNE